MVGEDVLQYILHALDGTLHVCRLKDLQMVGKDALQYSLWGGAALGLAVEWNNIRSQ